MLESLKDVYYELGYDAHLKVGLKMGIEEGERRAILRVVKDAIERSVAWEWITGVTGVTAEEFQQALEEKAER